MGTKHNKFIPPAWELCNYIVGLPVVLFLGNLQANILHLIFHQLYCLAGMDHGAKNFPFFPYNGLAQIALVNICIWIIHISVLENNSLCSCFHQVLVNKKSNSLSVHQYNFIFCTCYGNRIRSRHIVKLSLYAAAATAVKRLADDFLPICKQMRRFNLSHSNPKSLQPRWHSQRLALRFQKFSNLQFLLRATGVDEIGGFENIG